MAQAAKPQPQSQPETPKNPAPAPVEAQQVPPKGPVFTDFASI